MPGEVVEVAARVGRGEQGLGHLLGRGVRGARVEVLGSVELPGEVRGDEALAPLVVGDRDGLVVGGRPAQVHLHRDGAVAARIAVGGHERRGARRAAGRP